ncbi:LysE family translocator [Pseudoalteromonas sp. BZB3]|uniref:LysE family translocator n=1 Tax=Pseudoalteromonas sp. BZB3 TaxID=3136670 RepID=UPI0032C4387D
MTQEIILAFAAFAFVSSITPGPNNLMLMSSGANFGFKMTVPHLIGVVVGFAIMIELVGLGVMQLFNAFPVTYDILKVVSIVYLLYLAYKIATATPSESKDITEKGKPFSFMQAALFQWVNPKAWTMALTAVSVYTPEQNLLTVTIISVIFAVVGFPCVMSWIVLGQKMQAILKQPSHMQKFNWAMAGLLIISIVPAL